MNKYYKAFTLVELIVVITILAVLATVAFISFQGYSIESRDTKRLGDLATLGKGLQVHLAAHSNVPEPSETKTTVTFSGTELLTQGYAGESVINTIRVKNALDPIDKTFYTYSTNANNTKFQLVGFLENTQVTKNIGNKKIFADYSDRIKYSIGEVVGVLLDSDTPVQELGNSSIELDNNPTVYTAIFNKNHSTTHSGVVLKTKILGAQKNLYGWRAFDTNCPIEDIVIGDQVWAGCNSTLGNGIQWGEDNGSTTGVIGSCFNYGSSDNPAECSISNPLMHSNANPKKYFNIQHPGGANSNNDSEFDTIWGKLYTWENAIASACPIGRKVPSDQQWETLETIVNGGVNCRNGEDGWRCGGIGWQGDNSNQNNIANLLQLPLSGDRNQDGFTYYGRGNNSSYWTNTQADASLAYRRGVHRNNDGIYRNSYGKNYSFSVRCIKN